jgi:transmembrane protein 33
MNNLNGKRNSTGSRTGSTSSVNKIGPFNLNSHHLWFYGYVLFFVSGLIYVLNTALLRFSFINSHLLYILGLTALLSSLGITLGKTVKSFSLTMETIERAFQCDSLPYLVLALVLISTPPAPTAILPLLIYACYHAISFIQNDPKLSRNRYWKQYGEPSSIKLLSLQTSSMVLAAHLEVLTLPWLILSFILQRGASFTQAIAYAYFLRWQYYSSERIRSACWQWDAAIKETIRHPSCPPAVRNAERYVRSALVSFGQQLPTFGQTLTRVPVRPVSNARKDD